MGREGPEAASLYLSQTFTPGTSILAGAPAVVWNAQMHYAGLNATDIPTLADSQEFIDWLRVSQFKAIYVDESISPHFMDFINQQLGQGLTLGFKGVDGSHQVYLVTPQE